MMEIIIPKVSVIIPVYRAEEYIERCAKSLFEQTLEDVEYIFIDDKSPDKSIQVVKEVLERFPNRQQQVKFIINERNFGVGISRQKGLDAVEGEYIIHCDPDDWVDADMLEELYNIAVRNHSDIVLCDMLYEHKGKTVISKNNLLDLSVTALISNLLSGKLHGSLCNKLVKKEFVKSCNVSFVHGLNFCEDLTFCIKLLMCNPSIIYHPKAYYHYDKFSNQNSLSSVNTHYAKEQYFIWMTAFDCIMRDKKSSNYRTGIAFIAYWAFVHNLFTSEEYKNLYKHRISDLLFNDREWKVKIFTILSAIGLKNLMFKFYIYIKN